MNQLTPDQYISVDDIILKDVYKIIEDKNKNYLKSKEGLIVFLKDQIIYKSNLKKLDKLIQN